MKTGIEKGKWMVNCREATFLVSLKKEKRLSLKQRVALFFHMGYCDVCKQFARQVDWLENRLREYSLERYRTEANLSSDEKKELKTLINKGL